MDAKNAKACIFGGLVVSAYGIYVVSHAATGQPIPDGTLFAGVLAALGIAGGYAIASVSSLKGQKQP